VTQGTENVCLDLGYTPEQANLIGRIDDLFEEAIRLDLMTGDEAQALGVAVGQVMGKHTGKL